MAKSAIERLAEAIGYPEEIPQGVSPCVLRVDGAEVAVEEAGGRIVLSCALARDESLLPTLAAYAAGRMLKEDAVLAYGDGRTFLWQDAPAASDGRELARLFETFMDSLDWWRERVGGAASGRGAAEAEGAQGADTIVIRP